MAVAAIFPLIAASSGFTWIVDEPRYLYIVSPVFVLLVSVVLTSWRRAAVALALLSALTVLRARPHERLSVISPSAPMGCTSLPTCDPLIAELDRLHVDRVYAEYWDAYRIDFETDERIVAAESPQEVYARRGDKVVVLDNDHVRYRPYVDEVTRSPRPAHVVQAGSRDEANLDVPLLRATGYRRATADGYVIWYLPR